MRIKQPKTLLFIFVFLVGGVIFFILTKNLFLPKTPEIFVVGAKPHQPQKIRITNLSDNSFSVSWLTQKPTQKSAVNYHQQGSPPKTVEEPTILPTRVHQIDIPNLEPQTVYFFTILSDGKSFKKENNQPFEIKTLKTTEKPPGPPFILTGTVKNAQGNSEANVLVFFYNEQLNPLSILTNEKGNFIFALNNTRNKTDEKYFIPKNEQAKIMVETGEISYVKTFNITNDLHLLITPADQSEEANQPETQVMETRKQTLWQKMKEWIRRKLLVISY